MTLVTVVGGGVVGLTTALELAEAGYSVRVVRDLPVEETVSRVAAGLWFPYHVQPRDLALAWGRVSYERFDALAATDEGAAAGVRMARGVMVHRSEPDLWWTEGLAGVREATPEELPDGAPGGQVAVLPLIDTGAYLPWLESRCRAVGVDLVVQHVGGLSEVPGDVVVVAAGLRSAALIEDPDIVSGSGQVVRLANPGVTDWVVDDQNPAGMAYVLPHGRIVVCGGTDIVGGVQSEPDPVTERAILDRCSDLVPALRGAEVVSRAVGLRPVAPALRLNRWRLDGRDVVTNYGHGGAGVTLSWGCARDVVRLLG